MTLVNPCPTCPHKQLHYSDEPTVMLRQSEMDAIEEGIKADKAEIKRLRGEILSLEFELAAADMLVSYTYIRNRLIKIATNMNKEGE